MFTDALPLAHLYQKVPLIFAHRGARQQAPENTLAAFERAAELGCDGIELDVQFCEGGNLVVFHDEHLGRTCKGSERVRDTSLSALRSVDVGSHFAPAFAGERIPTLDEVFEAVGHRLLINVEIKYFATQPEIAQAVISSIHRHKLDQRVIISSFHPIILGRVRQIAPHIPIGLLHEEATPVLFRNSVVVRAIIGNFEAQHPHFTLVDRTYINTAHRRRHRVNVWTVNETADIQHMLDLGVDMIISDIPDRAIEMRAKQIQDIKPARINKES